MHESKTKKVQTRRLGRRQIEVRVSASDVQQKLHSCLLPLTTFGSNASATPLMCIAARDTDFPAGCWQLYFQTFQFQVHHYCKSEIFVSPYFLPLEPNASAAHGSSWPKRQRFPLTHTPSISASHQHYVTPPEQYPYGMFGWPFPSIPKKHFLFWLVVRRSKE